MGMFDTIKVETKIPGYSEIPSEEFQTKSFYSALENYYEVYRDCRRNKSLYYTRRK